MFSLNRLILRVYIYELCAIENSQILIQIEHFVSAIIIIPIGCGKKLQISINKYKKKQIFQEYIYKLIFFFLIYTNKGEACSWYVYLRNGVSARTIRKHAYNDDDL